MRENIIKTYWQAMDKDGRESIFTQRPLLDGGVYELTDGCRSYKNLIYTFPIPLKPLQIAEIKVNENGTWSYEIEREEGYYMAKEKNSGFVFLSNNYGGEWKNQSGVKIHLGLCTISPTRIPDECII